MGSKLRQKRKQVTVSDKEKQGNKTYKGVWKSYQQDRIQQGSDAEQGFGWQGAAPAVLGPSSLSLRQHASVVLAVWAI